MAEQLKPLFYSDTETLSRLLGLHNLGGGTTSEDLLEHSVTEAATTFWNKLGTASLATLQAVSKVVPPTTDAHFKRLLCEQLEVDVVRYHLSAHMGMGYKDGRADFVDTWNTESKFRRFTPKDIAAIREVWWKDKHRGIEFRFGILTGKSASRVQFVGHNAEDGSIDPVLLHTVSYYKPANIIDLRKLGFEGP